MLKQFEEISIFTQFFAGTSTGTRSRKGLRMGGLSRNWQKIVKMGGFPPKFIIKVGIPASLGN